MRPVAMRVTCLGLPAICLLDADLASKLVGVPMSPAEEMYDIVDDAAELRAVFDADPSFKGDDGLSDAAAEVSGDDTEGEPDELLWAGTPVSC